MLVLGRVYYFSKMAPKTVGVWKNDTLSPPNRHQKNRHNFASVQLKGKRCPIHDGTTGMYGNMDPTHEILIKQNQRNAFFW